MVNHNTRILAITFMLALSIIGIVVMSGLGQTEGTAFGALIGFTSVLAPAFFDALGVQRRGTAVQKQLAEELENHRPAQWGTDQPTSAETDEELLENRK